MFTIWFSSEWPRSQPHPDPSWVLQSPPDPSAASCVLGTRIIMWEEPRGSFGLWCFRTCEKKRSSELPLLLLSFPFTVLSRTLFRNPGGLLKYDTSSGIIWRKSTQERKGLWVFKHHLPSPPHLPLHYFLLHHPLCGLYRAVQSTNGHRKPPPVELPYGSEADLTVLLGCATHL